MRHHRDDFEPFVEDNVPFECHCMLMVLDLYLYLRLIFFYLCELKIHFLFFFTVNLKFSLFSVVNMAEPGTYGGNGCIVAFARLNSVDVVIHQLNTPMWQGCIFLFLFYKVTMVLGFIRKGLPFGSSNRSRSVSIFTFIRF